tara:strand:- start:355 stop:537 length:183 start_codon:yes stop_codon:yes gene_type:complete
MNIEIIGIGCKPSIKEELIQAFIKRTTHGKLDRVKQEDRTETQVPGGEQLRREDVDDQSL